MDIAVVNTWDNNFNVFLGRGNGSFSRRYVYPTGILSAPNSIVTADLNHDGRIDVVTTHGDTGTVGVFLAFEYVSFTTHIIDIPGSRPTPSCIVTGDFNNDHLPDIAVGNTGTDTPGIYLNSANGTFSEEITISIESYPLINFLAVGDFNNDHHQDLVFASAGSSTLGVFLGYGNGSFHSLLSYSTGDWSTPISVADFSKDKKLDIVGSGFNENIQGVV